jgi:hypothetical protein
MKNDIRLILQDLEGRVLLMQKEGAWCLPGKFTSDSSTNEAISYVEENTGLKLADPKYLFEEEHKDTDSLHVTTYYKVTSFGSTVLTAQYRWILPIQLQQYKIPRYEEIQKYLTHFDRHSI